ncbi:hypothetical protein GCM10009720_01280 [Yaniella flava]|uniref:Uncharacterized protein n=1 Tax=Yaniella flava TaxID=287930 RepID=A0ABN2TZ06_9MICC|nr:hypothetical protein [Micrococcaceae bacterium]
MKRKLIFGLALVLALTGITLGILVVVTAHDSANNLSPLAASASMGAVLLILVYSRLRKADQADRE